MVAHTLSACPCHSVCGVRILGLEATMGKVNVFIRTKRVDVGGWVRESFRELGGFCSAHAMEELKKSEQKNKEKKKKKKKKNKKMWYTL